MTDRPNLAAFALCAAVAISTGLGLVLYLLTGAVSWSQLGSLCLLAVFVLAWVPAWGLRAQFDHWDRGEQARIAAQQLANAERARAAQQAEPPEPEQAPDYSRDWKIATRHFVTAGERWGFGIRQLGRGAHQVVAWHDWERLVGPLVAGGWLISDNAGTVWAGGRDYDAWQEQRGWDALPYPTAEKPPTVLITAATRNSNAKETHILEGQGELLSVDADA